MAIMGILDSALCASGGCVPSIWTRPGSFRVRYPLLRREKVSNYITPSAWTTDDKHQSQSSQALAGTKRQRVDGGRLSSNQ